MGLLQTNNIDHKAPSMAFRACIHVRGNHQQFAGICLRPLRKLRSRRPYTVRLRSCSESYRRQRPRMEFPPSALQVFEWAPKPSSGIGRDGFASVSLNLAALKSLTSYTSLSTRNAIRAT